MTINSEVLAALIFLFFGGVAVLVGWSYGFGTMAQLGPGAMPVLAGGGLCILGIAQLGRTAIAARAGQRLGSAFRRSELRPLLAVLGAVLSFGLLIEPLGLVPALVALIAIGWFAEQGGRRWEVAAVMVAVIVLIILIFYFGLGIPFRLVAWRF